MYFRVGRTEKVQKPGDGTVETLYVICTFELIASRKYKRQTLKQLTLRKSFVLLIERVDIRKQKSFLSSSRSTSSSLNQRPNEASRAAGVSSWLRANCEPSSTTSQTQYQVLQTSTSGCTERPEPQRPHANPSLPNNRRSNSPPMT